MKIFSETEFRFVNRINNDKILSTFMYFVHFLHAMKNCLNALFFLSFFAFTQAYLRADVRAQIHIWDISFTWTYFSAVITAHQAHQRELMK